MDLCAHNELRLDICIFNAYLDLWTSGDRFDHEQLNQS